MFTDPYLAFVETVQQRVQNLRHSNTYLYLFTHKGTASFSRTARYHGTSHADDLIPLFPLRKTAFYSSIPSNQDRELIEVMNRMWTNFAIFGYLATNNNSTTIAPQIRLIFFFRNPTPTNTVPNWPSVTSSSFTSMQYMQIGNKNGLLDDEVLTVTADYYSTRAEFWTKVREEYNLNSWLDE